MRRKQASMAAHRCGAACPALGTCRPGAVRWRGATRICLVVSSGSRACTATLPVPPPSGGPGTVPPHSGRSRLRRVGTGEARRGARSLWRESEWGGRAGLGAGEMGRATAG